MNKRKDRFKSDGTREIEYVLIEDKPSAEDENEVKNKINGFLTATDSTSFKNTNNVAEFVGIYSDKPFDSVYKTKQELPAEFAEQLYNLPTGQVFGPYMDGKYYSISKMLGRKSAAKAKASHILISWEGTQVPNKKEKN